MKTKVAIIDDHELVRSSLCNCLTIWGYDVIIQACSGRDFLNQVEDNNLPDICITDIKMPELNGLEIIKIIRRTWPSIKIVIHSMNVVVGNRDMLIAVDGVISKSDDVSYLKAILQQFSNDIPESTYAS